MYAPQLLQPTLLAFLKPAPWTRVMDVDDLLLSESGHTTRQIGNVEKCMHLYSVYVYEVIHMLN